ncbi:MAG: dimethyl sulfoxide reductase anchor subunit [Sphingomonadales bacterium]|jgi:DMSO reductase anchor subunit
MHPAFSVIFFTTVSGAGYGLAIWLGITALMAPQTLSAYLLAQMLGLSMALMGAGLISSGFHLGNPKRAWRAFSQWRSSWLSREGVMAVLTFVPLGLAFVQTIYFGKISPPLLILGAVMSIVTLYTTSMIYASLKAIPAWHNQWVVWGFQTYGFASGGVVFMVFPGAHHAWPFAVVILLLIALVIKIATWIHVDKSRGQFKREAALALSDMGVAKPFDPAHNQENYVQREMGYNLNPRRRAYMRWLAIGLGFIVPALLLFLTNDLGFWQLGAVLASLSCLIGLGCERWLFFAEAQHVVRLFFDKAEV